MTTTKDIIGNIQELNGHVTKMFNRLDEDMKTKHGKSIIDCMTEDDANALVAATAQVPRMMAIFMTRFVPEKDLTNADKARLAGTISCCDELVKTCVSLIKNMDREKFTVHVDEEDEEEDEDEDEMEDRLTFLRSLDRDKVKSILKEDGLTKKEMDWVLNIIDSDDDDEFTPDDIETGFTILKKLGMR